MDFHNHFNTTNRAEAERWLSTAVKLLTTRDLHGTKSFAIRARESDPRLGATDQLIAVADTLLAGESRINNQPDWYAILQLAHRTHSLELVATQYRRLALLLNPQANRFPYADQAFRLVSDAWTVLSNPSKKALYDHDLNIYSRFDSPPPSSGSTQLFERQFLQMHAPPPPPLQPPFQQRLQPLQRPQQLQGQPFPHQLQPQPLQQRPQPPPQTQERRQPPPPPPPQNQQSPPQKQQQQQHKPVRKSPRKKDGRVAGEEETPNPNNVANNVTELESESAAPLPSESLSTTQVQAESDSGNFWTACPYCYHLFEYSRVYEECMLRCQNCKRAFHAVVISTPPVMDNGEANFCCWAYFPMGLSGSVKDTGGSSNWTPFSTMFACPLPGTKKKVERPKNAALGSRVYYDDDDAFLDISDPSEESDDEWQKDKRTKKRAGRPKGKASTSRTPARASDRLRKVTQNVGGQGMGSNGWTPGAVSASNGESSKKTSAGARKRGAAALGKLDLNVEFSNNEVEEHAAQTMSDGNGTANREEDNIGGIEFFEGLDEFLSSLPILNVVGDDKVKAN
ncbi:hypothetical protein ABKV19_000005 [Rosa sericea]